MGLIRVGGFTSDTLIADAWLPLLSRPWLVLVSISLEHAAGWCYLTDSPHVSTVVFMVRGSAAIPMQPSTEGGIADIPPLSGLTLARHFMRPPCGLDGYTYK